MKRFTYIFLIIIFISLLCGCIHIVRERQPASRKFDQEEAEWIGVIKESYPNWKPPYFSPVNRSQNLDSQVLPEPIKTVPLFLEENSTITELSETPDIDTFVIVPENEASIIPATNDAPQFYTIEKGDTLRKISLKFYGVATDWKKILNANQSIIKDSNRIKVGMKISIPR